MFLLLGDFLCAIGALFSFYATYKLGFSDDKREVFKYSGVSCVFLLVGSVMIGSWPAVALNVVWLALSYLGYKEKPVPKSFIKMITVLWFFVVLGFSFMLVGHYSLSALMCVSVYIVSYSAFAGGVISRREYLLWCLIGYVMFVPHLYEVQNYSVLVMESISFLLGVAGLLKIGLLKDRVEH